MKINELAPEEIVSFKQKHCVSNLYDVQVESEGNTYIFLFKKADRKTISAMFKLGQTDHLNGLELLIKNTLVLGDVALLEDVSVFLALAEQVQTINAAAQSTLKNL